MVAGAANKCNWEVGVVGDVYSEEDEDAFGRGGNVGGGGDFGRVGDFEIDELETLGRWGEAFGARDEDLVEVTNLGMEVFQKKAKLYL